MQEKTAVGDPRLTGENPADTGQGPRGAPRSVMLGWSPRAWIFALLAFISLPAAAHVQSSPQNNNRYLKVTLTGGAKVRFAYTVMFGERPALAARKRADLDGNGILDQREIDAFAAGLGQAVAAGLEVEADGGKRALSWDPPVPGVSDAHVGPIPLSVDLVGYLPLAGRGPHVVRFEDRTPLDSLGETEIRIEEGPGTQVLQGWRARDDGRRVLRFLWNGPPYSTLEDRSVGFRFVDETVRRRRRLPIAFIGLALSAAAALGLALRRRKSS